MAGKVHVKAHTRKAPKKAVVFDDSAGSNAKALTEAGISFKKRGSKSLDIKNPGTTRQVFFSAKDFLSNRKK